MATSLQAVPRHVGENCHFYSKGGNPVYQFLKDEKWFSGREKRDLLGYLDRWGLWPRNEGFEELWGGSWQKFKNVYGDSQKRWASKLLAGLAHARPDGKRNATLADARKHDLVAGWSRIASVKRSFSLERWKLGQMLIAARTCPEVPGETEEQLIDRIWLDADEVSSEAAERGTRLHAAIQQYLLGLPFVVEDDLLGPFDEFSDWEKRMGVSVISVEECFASSLLGYGGKMDLRCKIDVGSVFGTPQIRKAIVDFKSQDTKGTGKAVFYAEHCNQLVAYRDGSGNHDYLCVSVVIPVDCKASAQMKIWSEDDCQVASEKRRAMVDLWCLENKYDPREG